MNERVVGVKRLSAYLKRVIDADKNLRGIGVTGEISNLKPSTFGLFFNLKEEEAVLSCVAWSDVAGKLPALRDGQAITAYGSLTTWPKRSGYQFVVRNVVVDGVGDLHQRLEDLCRRLAAEGLFDRPKRALPRCPFHIALVSSPRADGYKDFVRIVRERAPHVRITLLETPVQGLAAVPEIVEALEAASRLNGIDAIVLARGGGSAEDIFAFSQEAVVRAVAGAAHPIISAIGHAKDVPLCDLAADVRAQTPSNAAHLLTERTTYDLLGTIEESRRRLTAGVGRPVVSARRRLHAALDRSALLFPERVLAGQRRRWVDAIERMERVDPLHRVAEQRTKLATLEHRLSRIDLFSARLTRVALALRGLEASDPTAILARGYAIVEHNGRIVRDAESVPPGDVIEARLGKGRLVARVEGRQSTL
jgi:exodeoxyribonuclease VII large subunit